MQKCSTYSRKRQGKRGGKGESIKDNNPSCRGWMAEKEEKERMNDKDNSEQAHLTHFLSDEKDVRKDNFSAKLPAK